MAKSKTVALDEFGCTPQEQEFVREYVKDWNGTRSAKAAGYAHPSAGVTASHLLKKKGVKAALSAFIEKRNEKLEIDAAYVLRQAVKLHERCMQEIKPKLVWDRVEKEWVHDTDDEGRGIYIFNATGAAKALELVGKHIDVQAFNDQSTSTIQHALAGLSDDELKKRRDELEAKRKALEAAKPSKAKKK